VLDNAMIHRHPDEFSRGAVHSPECYGRSEIEVLENLEDELAGKALTAD
jgi:hypothetical protein